MKPRYPYGAVAVWCVGFFALVPNMCAQEATAPKHIGVPQDWSQKHIVFSRDALAQHPDLIYREPRILHQAMQRWQAPNSDVFHGAEPLPASVNNSGHGDWNMYLGGGGRIAPNMFPAKFSFDPAAPPDCNNDYVVLGLTAIGVTGGQANLVAFNHLYAGTGGLCGAAPTVLFAYNITTVADGRISTSPVLSEDGTKIAFVESVPGTTPPLAIFHVLTWTRGQGTIAAAAAPASMTSLTFSPTANSTRSSPWVDYIDDIAYLGADNGKLYKITGVFKGTPTLAATPWPVTVSPNSRLTSPVLDAGLGMLMVGSGDGNLYQINTATGALASPLVVGLNNGGDAGIVAAPIVDVTNFTTFVVSSNGASSAPSGFSAVLVQADTLSNTELSRNPIGLGSSGGAVLFLYEPAFTNQYFTNPSNGDIRLCGTGDADTTPWQYSFGFIGRIMRTTISSRAQLLTSTAARCTEWTEFFNPNVGAGGTDFFFFGLTQDCTAPGTGTADGCVWARSSNGATTTNKMATVTGGPSGIVVDNYSTARQASSIYLCAAGEDTAYKFIQNTLK